MVGDEKGYRYEPATIAAQPGDGVKFVMASFGPHNVAFDPATIPADQRDQLYANMPNSEAGVSPMLMDEAEVWESVPASRTTAGWILRRAFQVGNSWSRCELGMRSWMQHRASARRGAPLRVRAAISPCWLMLQRVRWWMVGQTTRRGCWRRRCGRS